MKRGKQVTHRVSKPGANVTEIKVGHSVIRLWTHSRPYNRPNSGRELNISVVGSTFDNVVISQTKKTRSNL